MYFSKKREEAVKQIKDEMAAHKKRYKIFLEEILKEGKLDGDVIRVEDGKRGKILVSEINPNFYADLYYPYELQFHPYTKKGELSKMQSGSISNYYPDFNDYKPYKEGDEK